MSDITINIGASPSIYSLPERQFSKKYLYFGLEIILIFLFTFPFTMLDLHYGYSNLDCLNYTWPNTNITLSKWLIIISYINIITFSISFILFLITGCKKNIKLGFKVFKIFFITCSILLIIGTILGFLLFYRYTNYKSCSNTISNYLFSRLIIGLIFWPIELIRILKY